MAPSVYWSGWGYVRRWQLMSYDLASIRRVGSDPLVCNFVTIDALQLLEMDRGFPLVGGAVGVEGERCRGRRVCGFAERG